MENVHLKSWFPGHLGPFLSGVHTLAEALVLVSTDMQVGRMVELHYVNCCSLDSCGQAPQTIRSCLESRQNELKAIQLRGPDSSVVVVVYQDSGGTPHLWAGPAEDWPTMSAEYGITSEDVIDSFGFFGHCVSIEPLKFECAQRGEAI